MVRHDRILVGQIEGSEEVKMQSQEARPYKNNIGCCGAPVILALLFILNAIIGRGVQTTPPKESQSTQHVLPNYLPLPTYTPKTPAVLTQTPLAPLMPTFNDGFYLINAEIAAGIWRNDGTTNDCHWAVTTKTGDIVSNYFGMSGGTANIPVIGFQFQTQDCGNWTYLGQ
jgi:hypothetical protein